MDIYIELHLDSVTASLEDGKKVPLYSKYSSWLDYILSWFYIGRRTRCYMESVRNR